MTGKCQHCGYYQCRCPRRNRLDMPSRQERLSLMERRERAAKSLRSRNPEGVRPYGPGKFDSLIDAFLYNLTLDGGSDEDISDDDFGHFELIKGPFVKDLSRVAREDGEKLTKDEVQHLTVHKAGAILSEDDSGFVSVKWFKTRGEMLEEWEDLENEYNKFLELSEEEI